MVSIAPRITSAVTGSTVGVSLSRPRLPASWTRSTCVIVSSSALGPNLTCVSSHRILPLEPVDGVESGAEMSEHREFKDVLGVNEEGAAGLPVDEFMAGLEALQAEVATEKNLVWERVADGTLSEDLLKRLAKEYYFLGKWYTTEFGTLT